MGVYRGVKIIIKPFAIGHTPRVCSWPATHFSLYKRPTQLYKSKGHKVRLFADDTIKYREIKSGKDEYEFCHVVSIPGSETIYYLIAHYLCIALLQLSKFINILFIILIYYSLFNKLYS